MIRKACFPPVTGPDSRLLILGSLPGEQSLAKAQYYGHPRNQFWRLVGAATESDLERLSYADRLDAIRNAGIALWDVIASASRRGSLDASIRDLQGNDLRALIADLPHLRAVAFNGGTAASIGRRLIGEESGLALLALPSSSPAYTLPFERKREAWVAIKAYL